MVKDFVAGFGPVSSIDTPMLVPQIGYLTNDSWEESSALAGPIGYPMLHRAGYSKGALYVLTIPDNFADLYRLPAPVLAGIRQALSKDLDVRLEGPANVALFAYDNGTFIVESFLPEPVKVNLVIAARYAQLEDVLSGEPVVGRRVSAPRGFQAPPDERLVFEAQIKPHSYRVFRGSK